MHADLVHIKNDLPARVQARADQILDDFVLSIHCDCASGQVLEVDPVTTSSEANFDPVMHQTFALQAITHSHLNEQFHRAPLEHARPDPFFAILPAAILQHKRIDSLQMKQMG